MQRRKKAAWPRVALAAALLLFAAAPAHAQEDKPARGPDIDVVICLDVSGGMQGLFGSTKLKLWDIVNDLGKVEPTPNLRVGLYSYGHGSYEKKTGCVRKEIDLTTDLDEVSRKLNALTIRGSSEEYVARVCRDAVRDQSWSKDKKALKVIFVCGNESASQDPTLKLKDVAEMAIKKDIVINPIFCGPADHKDAADWKDFAKMARGRFSGIDQNRGTMGVSTPQDKEIVALSEKLNATYIPYGKEGLDRFKNQRTQDDNAYQVNPETIVTRASYKASNLYRNESWDLVDRLKLDPKFDVKKVSKDELTPEMQKMTPEEREQYVKDMLARREELQKKIVELNKKREEYIRGQKKSPMLMADCAFDDAVRGALREQAAAKGIKIPAYGW
jgi:hypothetical protein